MKKWSKAGRDFHARKRRKPAVSEDGRAPVSHRSLVEHVIGSIQSRGLLVPGQGTLLAVSGGLDSIVLLHMLARSASEYGWRLVVAHFNHQLRRSASDADEAWVRLKCRRLGFPCIVGNADVRQHQRNSGQSIEMAARQLRHQFLASTALREGLETIATGHHADDQVELFFLRLFRGAGSSGLAGMRWIGPSPTNPRVRIIRPLLDLSKDDLRAYALSHNLKFREDRTNRSLDYRRNKIRNKLLPLIRREHCPALMPAIGRLMELLLAESDCLSNQASHWLRSSRKPAFASLPDALQRWVVHHQLIELEQEPSWDLIEHLRANPGVPIMVAPERSLASDLNGKLHVMELAEGFHHEPRAGRPAKFKRFIGAAPGLDANEVRADLSKKRGELDLPNLRIEWSIQRQSIGGRIPRPQKRVEYFDADQVGHILKLRNWNPGDRFRPIGMPVAVKLQDLFVNQKVPRIRRHQLCLAETAKGDIFWVEGLRIGELCKITAQTRHRLKWHWKPRGPKETASHRSRP